MPKTAAKEQWEVDLRSALKAQHRFGYSVRQMRGKVELRRTWRDTGKCESVTLPIDWKKGCQRDVLNAVAGINECLVKGQSLKEAMLLACGAAPRATSRKNLFNWRRVMDQYRQKKVENGKVKPGTWEKEFFPRLKQLIEILDRPGGPNNAKKALEEMRYAPDGSGKPGTNGRRVRIQKAEKFLEFAVDECGADQRWAPPPTKTIKELIGERPPNDEKAANEGTGLALSDENFLALFDSIKNPRWKLAVGLVGVFGLRPVELNYIIPTDDGLYVPYEKRNGSGTTDKRHVPILDPAGREGLARQLLLTLQAGLVELPPLGSTDKAAGVSLNQGIMRNPVWMQLKKDAKSVGGRISCYSMRHCFANRCAMALPPITAKAAAVAMGHSYKTHLEVYQKKHEPKEVNVQFARARAVSCSA